MAPKWFVLWLLMSCCCCIFCCYSKCRDLLYFSRVFDVNATSISQSPVYAQLLSSCRVQTNSNTFRTDLSLLINRKQPAHKLSEKSRKSTIIAACKERNEQLRQVFSSWLSVRHVDEIVLVDWSSKHPLINVIEPFFNQVPESMHLMIVRVENATQWNLAQAYNLAAVFSSGDWCFKVDCDTWVHSLFLEKHIPKSGIFYSASGAGHLHGIFYIPRNVFYQIRGFDERIHSYGWEDDSLLQRAATYLQKEPIDIDSLAHLPHPAELRWAHQSCLLGNDCLPALEVQFNRILYSKHLPSWSEQQHGSEYVYQRYCNHSNLSFVQLCRKSTVMKPHLSTSLLMHVKKKSMRIILETKYRFPRQSIANWPVYLLENVLRQVIRKYPLLLISVQPGSLEHLFACCKQLAATSNLTLIYTAKTMKQYRFILENGYPVIFEDNLFITNLFQEPFGTSCRPYENITRRMSRQECLSLHHLLASGYHVIIK